MPLGFCGDIFPGVVDVVGVHCRVAQTKLQETTSPNYMANRLHYSKYQLANLEYTWHLLLNEVLAGKRGCNTQSICEHVL